MKILLVEDDTGKRNDIKNELLELNLKYNSFDIVERESLRSAWRALSSDIYDLLILDMSLPSADLNDDSATNEPESFAGREILDQMRLRKILTPVVVVTQYKTFEKGSISLEQLVAGFSERYSPFFRGYIYYSSSASTWKRELKTHLSEIFNESSNRR